MMGLLQQLLPLLQNADLLKNLQAGAATPAATPTPDASVAKLQEKTDQMLGGKQAQNLAMMLMGAGSPQVATMQPIAMMPSTAPANQVQFGPQMAMQIQQQNDEMMRQRMQGLLGLLGGQR
jgi:hypothetical protein